jgi:hypothetical protein
METPASSQKLNPLNFDLRSVDTDSAIDALRKYLSITEAQMDTVYQAERAAHEADAPNTPDEEERDLHRQIGDYIEQRYEQDLIPAMRYSFVVLVHIVFENQLRRFCTEMQRERRITLSLSDIAGRSPIERSSSYLTKVVGLPVGNLAEWQHLRTGQKIRDAIVHAYGHVDESRDKQDIQQLVAKNGGISIDESGRLALTQEFCENYLASVEKLFFQLFVAVDWYKPQSPPNMAK